MCIRDSNKKAATSGGGHGQQEAAARAQLAKDPRTARLLGAGKSLGNEELRNRLGAGNASRDEMLAYIVKHLERINERQHREMHAADPKEMQKEGKKIADSHKTCLLYTSDAADERSS